MKILHRLGTMAIIATLMLFCAPASADIRLVFDKPTGEDVDIKNFIESPTKDLITIINAEAPIQQEVTIRIGGDDGPLFDPQSNTIIFPYDFFYFIIEAFEDQELAIEGVTLEDSILNVYIHILLHEYAHAYFFNWDVPLLGKEEDAADVFATLFMLNVFDDSDMAYVAIDFYALLDANVDAIDDLDLWGEHSLDYQRYTQSLCLVYGSDPKKYAGIMDKALKDIERDTYCIQEFDVKNDALSKIINRNQ